MRLSTVLALVLAVVFAAANPFALLMKRDSSSSITSTLTPGTDSSPFADTSTEILTATPTATTDPSATWQSSFDDGDMTAMIACYPHNATGYMDFSTPCNQLMAIEAQCAYGPKALGSLSSPFDSDYEWPELSGPDWKQQSPETERTCICQSQFIDASLGCAACLSAHERPDMSGFTEMIARSSMQNYCDLDNVITQSFLDFWNDAYRDCGSPGEAISFSSYTGQPLGTSTDVSLYYTMSVTRGDAYDIAVPTAVSGADAKYTTTRISDGQIVPTAQAKKEVGEQDPGETGTPSISTSSTSSFGDSFTTSSASLVSRTRSLNLATPSASQSPSDYEGSVEQAMNGCLPRNATGNLDFDAPCNQLVAIKAQCAYGPQALQLLTAPVVSDSNPEFNPGVPKVSPEAERTCICQSQYADAEIGCFRCMKAHQLLLTKQNLEVSIHARMEQYCDVDYKATQSFSEFAFEFAVEYFSEHDAPMDYFTAEIISTSTDVSLYYTMSVTRSDAYDIAVPTPSSRDVFYTSTRTSGGQIVPTARTVKDPGSPTTDSGAAVTNAGAAGMLAVAALAAFGL
jgi:hypothetical protein